MTAPLGPVDPALSAAPGDAVLRPAATTGAPGEWEPSWPTEPGVPAEPGPQVPPEPVLTPRAITLSVATVTTSLLVAVAGILAVPYAVDSPGPTLDTLGAYNDTPLITVVGAPTFPSEGELRLTTVGVLGGPNSPVSLLAMVRGWLDGTRAVRPVEEVVPQDQSAEEIEQANQAAMISSQENATVAALEELGYVVPTALTIGETLEGTGAADLIEPDDVMVAIDGEELSGFSELATLMDGVEPGAVVTVTVERAGERQDLEVTTVDDGTGRALLGVLVDPTFDLPVDVRIEIEDIGGPSAGLMFSLGIIDTLTEPDETGGVSIAGTGTMDLTGTVGPIGGIRQKMAGADRDGAAWFLAPVDNCPEVVGHVPAGLQVAAVGTLSEARAAVEAIGSGHGDDLPTCGEVMPLVGRGR